MLQHASVPKVDRAVVAEGTLFPTRLGTCQADLALAFGFCFVLFLSALMDGKDLSPDAE